MPPEASAAPSDPLAIRLPKIALAALATVPDYNIDPLLLAGLRKKLSQTIAAESRLHGTLGDQQRETAGLRAEVKRLQAEADRGHQSAIEARRRFQLAVSSNYMSGDGLSPALNAMFSPASHSPEDVMYSADVIGQYATDQGALARAALRQMHRATAAAQAEQDVAVAAARRLRSTQRRHLAAQQAAALVRQQIKARIIAVRQDLAAKQAAQRVTSGTSIEIWQSYLATLGSYGVHPPLAAQLRDPNHLPRGLQAVLDASGVKQAGVAALPTAHGNVLVLPREVIVAIGFAYGQLGKPYVWAATGPNSFDCSGLMLAAFRSAGITSMPRTAAEQYAWTPRITPGQEMPGDLVFFQGDDGTATRPGHVALVVDPVRHLMIQAPQTGDVVKISDYSQWGGLIGFGRVTTAA